MEVVVLILGMDEENLESIRLFVVGKSGFIIVMEEREFLVIYFFRWGVGFFEDVVLIGVMFEFSEIRVRWCIFLMFFYEVYILKGGS